MGLYVGVDPSLTSPGIAILDEVGSVVSATSFSVGRDVRGSERLTRNAQWAADQLRGALGGVRRVCVEGPSLGSVHREFDLGEASGALKGALYLYAPVEPVIVEPVRVKLFATGLAGAPKAEVLHAVKTRYGLDFDKDDDACDAWVLARIAWAIDHKRLLTRRCELEVVNAILGTPKKKTLVRKRLRSTDNL